MMKKFFNYLLKYVSKNNFICPGNFKPKSRVIEIKQR